MRRGRRSLVGAGGGHAAAGREVRRLHAEDAGDRDRRRLRALPGSMSMEASAHQRHRSVTVQVGRVTVGGDAPIVVQSMTNTDTGDVTATAAQVAALAQAGSEIVRITVDRDEAAAAVPHIK